MSYKTTACERKSKVDGTLNYGQALCCDLCKDGPFSCFKGYFRCEFKDCDWDVCVKNWLYKKKEKMAKICVLDLQCENKHPIKFYSKRSRKTNRIIVGVQYKYTGDDLNCQRCG